MNEHVHEWIYQQSTYGHYECPCGATLHCVEAESRLNATERLSATKAQLYSEHIIEDPPFLVDECAADLKAYADALEGK